MANFVVIGMARSGTSFLSSWLHKIGITMGDNFLPADRIMNEKGFYEDTSFHQLQVSLDNLYNDLDVNYLLKNSDYTLRYNKDQFEEGVRLVTEKEKQYLDWGWKITAETKRALSSFWIPIFLHKKIAPCFLIAFRHFDYTVGSLMRVKYLKRKENSAFGAWKLKWLSFNKNKYANHFLKEWIDSNNEILRCYDKYKEFSYVFIETPYLLEQERRIFHYLDNMANNRLQYYPPSDMYDKQLMDRPAILNYKLNPSLRKEAEVIYQSLIAILRSQKI